MSNRTFREGIRTKEDTTEAKNTINTSQLKWGHFDMDTIQRMVLFNPNGATKEAFKMALMYEMKSMALNFGVSVEYLYDEIYKNNQKLINDHFFVRDRLTTPDYKRVLAVLTIPISIERDNLQR